MKKRKRVWGIELSALLLLVTLRAAAAQEVTTLVLDNGMHFILQENHSNPMISSVVTVKAGSRYETVANSGVSHLLEHLLFSGTRSRSREEIAGGIKVKSGYLNAFTRKDATAYVLLIPKEYADDGLEIQADMLFNSTLPEKELAKERKVVIEEINKELDNPNYSVELAFDQKVYAGTPYARPILGYKNVIENLPRPQILEYYHQRYVPNNMVALITGDFDAEEMAQLLEKRFDAFPPGPLSPELSLPPPAWTTVSSPTSPKGRVVYRPGPVQGPQIQLAFPAPAFRDPDYPAFSLWVSLLTLEEGAPLIRALKGVSPPVALWVSTDLSLQAGWSTFIVRLALVEGPGGAQGGESGRAGEQGSGGAGENFPQLQGRLKERAQQAIQQTLQVLQEAAHTLPDPAQIRRALIDLKVQEYSLQEKLHYYGMAKAPLIALAGYELVGSYVEKVSALKPEDFQRASSKFLSAPPYLAVVVHPPGELEEEKAGETPKEEALPPRGVEVAREVLANGLTVIARGNPDTRLFAIHILAKDRAYLEPPGKAGAADFLSRMLLRGTQTRTAAQISQALADIGAQVKVVDDPSIPYDDFYTSPAYTYFRFETIEEYADPGLDLLADLVRRPAFPAEEMEKVRREMLTLIASQKGSPSQTARRLLYAELFKEHPFSRGILGTEESISALALEDLEGLHRKLFAPDNLIVALEGNFSALDMIAKVALRFGDLEPVNHPEPIPPPFLKGGGERRVTLKMEKEQAALSLGLPLTGRESPEVPALQLMTSILSSRLASQLREVQGLAYAVGANAQFFPGFGWLQVSLATTPANLEVAREGIFKEMSRMKEGLVEEMEREAAINGAWGSFLMSCLSSINRAYYASLFELLGLPIDYGLGLRQRLNRVSREEIQRVARAYLDTENFVLAITGGP